MLFRNLSGTNYELKLCVTLFYAVTLTHMPYSNSTNDTHAFTHMWIMTSLILPLQLITELRLIRLGT